MIKKSLEGAFVGFMAGLGPAYVVRLLRGRQDFDLAIASGSMLIVAILFGVEEWRRRRLARSNPASPAEGA